MRRWGDIEELAKEVTRGGQGSLSTTVGYRTTDRLVMSHCGLVTLSKRLISTPAGYRDPLQCIERGRYQPTCYKGTRNYHARTILCNTTQYFCVHYPPHTQYHARFCKVLQYHKIQDNLMLVADIMALLTHCIHKQRHIHRQRQWKMHLENTFKERSLILLTFETFDECFYF